MTSPTPPEPVEERLADRLSARHGRARPSRAVRLLRRLGRFDRAAYRAVAEMSTPRAGRPAAPGVRISPTSPSRGSSSRVCSLCSAEPGVAGPP